MQCTFIHVKVFISPQTLQHQINANIEKGKNKLPDCALYFGQKKQYFILPKHLVLEREREREGAF